MLFCKFSFFLKSNCLIHFGSLDSSQDLLREDANFFLPFFCRSPLWSGPRIQQSGFERVELWGRFCRLLLRRRRRSGIPAFPRPRSDPNSSWAVSRNQSPEFMDEAFEAKLSDLRFVLWEILARRKCPWSNCLWQSFRSILYSVFRIRWCYSSLEQIAFRLFPWNYGF